MESEEYELVPMNPIRRLEKRMERVEKNTGSEELMKDLLEIVRTNQEIVDDIIKTNSEMIDKVNNMMTSVNALITRLDDFISRVEIESEEIKEEGHAPEVEKRVDERLAKLEKRMNAIFASAMTRKLVKPRVA